MDYKGVGGGWSWRCKGRQVLHRRSVGSLALEKIRKWKIYGKGFFGKQIEAASGRLSEA